MLASTNSRAAVVNEKEFSAFSDAFIAELNEELSRFGSTPMSLSTEIIWEVLRSLREARPLVQATEAQREHLAQRILDEAPQRWQGQSKEDICSLLLV